ncbi:MAG TPA: gephyrin-like molybdotransferase Glp [Bryobacteraceae bacterium]|nr:gephyrin-like molybdotransferase Glp [Bryobacteraceae bacterium]
MPTLTFEAARACVVENVTALRALPQVETVTLADAAGRVLASPVFADRDWPATPRSVRDGFAVRSSDTPGRLRLAGEIRAGEPASAAVGIGECIEIMTGATIPEGADAVVMVEHTRREGDYIEAPAAKPGQFINPRASEARRGGLLLEPGSRIGFAEIALMAAAGCSHVSVFLRPRVAILATGDEIVQVHETPLAHQIRNSNAHSLAAQVRRAGGVPAILPVARDTRDATRALIEQGLAADLLLLSGGVSAGKYDVVEDVLASLGAGFYFDRALIQPGQPVVFGRVNRAFFFGLPGNPASTMVTFEIFARAAVELLGGQRESLLPLTLAPLATPFRHKPGLTRFLPARLDSGETVTHIPWQGSGDVPAIARANVFLVAAADRESWERGDLIQVLMK